MKILVTGCRGTLGAPLVKELESRGHTVFGIDLKHTNGKNYIRCDMSEYRQLFNVINGSGLDMVYHLAAEFGRINGEEYYEKVWKSNVIGTRNLLEIQRIIPFKLIFASSSEIYGDLKEEYLSEDLVPGMQKNDYAVSKWVNEIQCKNFREQHGNEIMVLRFFNAYGPGEYYTNYRSVVCLFCYRALRCIPYTVYKGYHRVFMFIDDFIPTIANACDRFINGETINIGGREYRSVEDLHNIIVKETGVDVGHLLEEDKHNITNKRPDIKKSEDLLAHNPKTMLEEGVKKTIQWMKGIYNV